jgi:hypothetical protein
MIDAPEQLFGFEGGIMKSSTALVLCALICAGCSLTLGVNGQFQDGSETFTGNATGYVNRSGTLEITSSKGAVCKGTFVYVGPRDGRGTFTCNDGRSGPFEFVSTGSSGTGTGQLGGKPFTFTFG